MTKPLIIFNMATNTLIVFALVYLMIKKYFHVSIGRGIFTGKIETISLMKNTGWFSDGSWCSATGLFTIRVRKDPLE